MTIYSAFYPVLMTFEHAVDFANAHAFVFNVYISDALALSLYFSSHMLTNGNGGEYVAPPPSYPPILSSDPKPVTLQECLEVETHDDTRQTASVCKNGGRE